MITRTMSGVVLPVVAPTQLPQLNARPNHYMNALRDSLVHHSHGEALMRQVKSEQQDGREFVTRAVEVITWNEPPRMHHDRRKGHYVDTWV